MYIYYTVDYRHTVWTADGWMDGWMNGRMDGWTDRRDGWTDPWTDPWTEWRTDGQMNGWKECWTARLKGMDRWTQIWWIDLLVLYFLFQSDIIVGFPGDNLLSAVLEALSSPAYGYIGLNYDTSLNLAAGTCDMCDMIHNYIYTQCIYIYIYIYYMYMYIYIHVYMYIYYIILYTCTCLRSLSLSLVYMYMYLSMSLSLSFSVSVSLSLLPSSCLSSSP